MMNRLQERIRKTKNPSVLLLASSVSELPPQIVEETPARAYGRFCRELVEELKDTIPAVRVSFSSFALLGADGWEEMVKTMEFAAEAGYYVILDGPELFSSEDAQRAARALAALPCHGMVISGYLGSDVVKPFLPVCKQKEKDLFVVVRTGNRSASQLQDLLAGSRQVYLTAADHVNRYAEEFPQKCGYCQVAVMAGAGNGDSLRTIRAKYPKLFILIDGYDYPHASAKNCAGAFDQFGHGAVVCGGAGILHAWKEAQSDGSDYRTQAKAAALRMKKNLSRYVTIL